MRTKHSIPVGCLPPACWPSVFWEGVVHPSWEVHPSWGGMLPSGEGCIHLRGCIHTGGASILRAVYPLDGIPWMYPPPGCNPLPTALWDGCTLAPLHYRILVIICFLWTTGGHVPLRTKRSMGIDLPPVGDIQQPVLILKVCLQSLNLFLW